jgi:signal transduction histidine kinase
MHRPITQASILRVLVAGFGLVIALLAAAAFVGVRSVHSIQSSAASLVREQAVANRLLDEVRHQQTAIGDIFSVLARDPDTVDLDILKQLDQTDRNIDRIVQEGERTPEERLWRQLKRSSMEFSAEARRLLNVEDPETFASRDLFRLHGEVVSIIGRLIEQSYRKVIAAQRQIDERSAGMMRESIIFLGACLPLALIFTVVTVRMTTQLFRSMEWQAGELSRVSWHMLDDQESTARRFSHELHDELGQSLTAVKANLAALENQAQPGNQRLDDCMRLVDEAIGNVRQLSQLLRPTILDDFGLEAGLRWLTEGFTHRTGIEVEFRSDPGGRLPEETETHLFRIAQEALTNVARHSGARRVWMDLHRKPGEVLLTIRDDGHGLPAVNGDRQLNGMGMIGMRARARSTGGDVTVKSKPGEGVVIEVRAPESGTPHDPKDPHSVS